jgi:hypothetical protein
MKNNLRLLMKTFISVLLLSSGKAFAADGGQCHSIFTRAARSEAFQMVRELNNRFFDLDTVDQDLRVLSKKRKPSRKSISIKRKLNTKK